MTLFETIVTWGQPWPLWLSLIPSWIWQNYVRMNCCWALSPGTDRLLLLQHSLYMTTY